jgi:hypothetical protein
MSEENTDIDPFSDMTFHDVVLKGRITDKAKTKKKHINKHIDHHHYSLICGKHGATTTEGKLSASEWHITSCNCSAAQKCGFIMSLFKGPSY